MQRIMPLVFCLNAIAITVAVPTYAQLPSIAEGVVALSPGVTVGVLRETSTTATPGYCSANPPPLECIINNGGGYYLGTSPLFPIGVDAVGSAYQFLISGPTSFGDGDGTLMQRIRPDGTTEDVARFYRVRCQDLSCNPESFFYFVTPLYLDLTNGRILVPMYRSLRQTLPKDQEIDGTVGILEISGLPKLFDTFLTFVPSGQAVSAVTPAHPDGFRSTDAMQVWAGDVRTLPDWSQAQPVTCNAATTSTPGQVITVADTLPDPPVGHGRYYLTASVNGLNRRLGRQYVNGAFSARDPSTLAVCQ